jgi:hypothetical protein
MELLFDEQGDELLALQYRRLSVFHAQGTVPARTVAFPDDAHDIEIDRKRNRLLISLPARFQVAVLDRSSLEIHSFRDAPAGVRVLAMDEARDKVLMGAVTGVLEIRDAGDFRLVGRTRLLPWIHWIAVFPEYGEAVITHGDIMLNIFRYDPFPAPGFSTDVLQYAFENFLRSRRELFKEK